MCDNGSTCHISLKITSGRTVLAQTGAEQIPAQGGGIIYFSLTGAGRSMLAHARGGRLLVRLTGQDVSKKLSLNRLITLVQFSTNGAAPARTASQSRVATAARLDRVRVLKRCGRRDPRRVPGVDPVPHEDVHFGRQDRDRHHRV